MQSKAATVDEYLKEVSSERLAALGRLRELCRTCLVGYEESMAHGMPHYAKEGTRAVAFNSQKGHIALYGIPRAVAEVHRDRLSDCGTGGCLRFKRPERIDFELVEALLRETAATPSR